MGGEPGGPPLSRSAPGNPGMAVESPWEGRGRPPRSNRTKKPTLGCDRRFRCALCAPEGAASVGPLSTEFAGTPLPRPSNGPAAKVSLARFELFGASAQPNLVLPQRAPATLA